MLQNSISTERARVLCVVVNWNGWRDTLACLQSLEAQTWTALDVCVVDNGSANESIEQLRNYIDRRGSSPVQMKLLQMGANLGFARGNNAGIRDGLTGDTAMVWLLNNDTVCPPDTLAKLMRAAKADPAAGMVGSVLYYAHDPAQVQAWGGGHMNPSIAFARHFTAPHTMAQDDYLTFASVLLRPAMLAQIGLLSEAFFMYTEDAEMCLRAQRAGWTLAVAPDTAILHREGGSSGVGTNLFLERTVTASGLYLIRRHGRLGWLGEVLFVAARLVRRLVRGNFAAMRAVLAGVQDARSGGTERP